MKTTKDYGSSDAIVEKRARYFNEVLKINCSLRAKVMSVETSTHKAMSYWEFIGILTILQRIRRHRIEILHEL